uniref:PLPB n=1 Tax=Arundo donax TaxID=35708 RepID=A0A0A9F5C4_ARUDO
MGWPARAGSVSRKLPGSSSSASSTQSEYRAVSDAARRCSSWSPGSAPAGLAIAAAGGERSPVRR